MMLDDTMLLFPFSLAAIPLAPIICPSLQRVCAPSARPSLAISLASLGRSWIPVIIRSPIIDQSSSPKTAGGGLTSFGWGISLPSGMINAGGSTHRTMYQYLVHFFPKRVLVLENTARAEGAVALTTIPSPPALTRPIRPIMAPNLPRRFILPFYLLIPPWFRQRPFHPSSQPRIIFTIRRMYTRYDLDSRETVFPEIP